MVAHPQVLEAAAIGVPDELKGEALWVFVVLAPGSRPATTLRAEISEVRHRRARAVVQARAGPIHDRTAEDSQREGAAPRDSRDRDRRRAG